MPDPYAEPEFKRLAELYLENFDLIELSASRVAGYVSTDNMVERKHDLVALLVVVAQTSLCGSVSGVRTRRMLACLAAEIALRSRTGAGTSTRAIRFSGTPGRLGACH